MIHWYMPHCLSACLFHFVSGIFTYHQHWPPFELGPVTPKTQSGTCCFTNACWMWMFIFRYSFQFIPYAWTNILQYSVKYIWFTVYCNLWSCCKVLVTFTDRLCHQLGPRTGLAMLYIVVFIDYFFSLVCLNLTLESLAFRVE